MKRKRLFEIVPVNKRSRTVTKYKSTLNDLIYFQQEGKILFYNKSTPNQVLPSGFNLNEFRKAVKSGKIIKKIK